MSTRDDDLIFPKGTSREISKQELEELKSPYAQFTQLMEILEAWGNAAAATLREHGHYVTDLVDNPVWSCQKFGWLFCYKVDAIQAPAARDAYELLVAINDLWKLQFQDDKSLIANAGIRVGLAVAKAHAREFEPVTRNGITATKGRKLGGDNAAENSRKSKDFCIEKAGVWWASDSDIGCIRRIGVMCKDLLEELKKQGHWLPAGTEQIKKWLKAAEKEGLLVIPKAAKKRGRNKNKF